MSIKSPYESLNSSSSATSYIGDAIIELCSRECRDLSELKSAIQKLKDLVLSAIQKEDSFDEDDLIERLFSRTDVDYASRKRQKVFKLSNGKTCVIHTTEVIDNTTGKERNVQSKSPDETQNPYLIDHEFGQATLCCCEEFLKWILERIEKQEVYGFSCVPFPYETIHNFIQDLSATELIQGFCKSTIPREKQSFTLPFFVDIENLAFFNNMPNNPRGEMISIFALRQVLESWFMRIVGFHGVVPVDGIDIRSWKFQRIIGKDFETNFHFKGPPVSFQSIRRIYQWTQTSIHWAYATNVWLLWKAITYCERLFGATVELPALERYRTEVVKLCIEESKFVKGNKPKKSSKKRLDKRTVLFRDPDIFVTDQGMRVNSYDVDGKGFSRLERNVIIRENPMEDGL